jgi:DNA replication and repair protein RecF
MITNIRLQNFRSYKDASFEFENGVNVIVGPNASGKTNLLEAILMIARGKSYRAKENELVHHQCEWARIDADIGTKPRIIKIERQATVVKKSFILDDKAVLRLTTAKQLPIVLFEPNQLQLITTSPEQRRNFLDNLLEQISPDFTTIKNRYLRTLTQRNALLKNPTPAAANQMFVWDIRLSELGGEIVHRRQELIDLFNQDITNTYSAIAGQPHAVKLSYQSKLDLNNYASSLLKKLESDHQLDQLRGFTGAGPHRDDIMIMLDGHQVQEAASRGETRTLLLALKIKEAQILEEQRDGKPLLLLDDVFGELDGRRRHMLTDFLKDYQVFITTTDADLIVKNFTKTSNIIALSNNPN